MARRSRSQSARRNARCPADLKRKVDGRTADAVTGAQRAVCTPCRSRKARASRSPGATAWPVTASDACRAVAFSEGGSSHSSRFLALVALVAEWRPVPTGGALFFDLRGLPLGGADRATRQRRRRLKRTRRGHIKQQRLPVGQPLLRWQETLPRRWSSYGQSLRIEKLSLDPPV
jgi:hypothetical protein